ncbi:MAG: EthD family reductase [Syntrophobacteraceae bacterium]
MVKISILYPNVKGSRFDVHYYVETHIPMAIELLSAHEGFKGVSVEHGLGGIVPGSDATYVVMCHFLFDSVDDFIDAFTPHAAALQGDLQNYSDVEPIIQVSAVLFSRQLFPTEETYIQGVDA